MCTFGSLVVLCFLFVSFPVVLQFSLVLYLCNFLVFVHLLVGFLSVVTLGFIYMLTYNYTFWYIWCFWSNWCFWTVVLEKALENPLDCKEIQPVHPKGNQSWVFIGRTDAEAETPVLWPPESKNWIIGKGPDAGKGGGEWDNRGWDGWMASLTLCTWVWVSSRSWWWTGKPGVLQSMGSQRVRHNLVTELNNYTYLFQSIVI